ncbi:MAG TPA: hypothetical protein VFG95_03450, partial [Nitrospiria bacterium]|nr:hypothetical protein [Nitrospiria bacterium]
MESDKPSRAVRKETPLEVITALLTSGRSFCFWLFLFIGLFLTAEASAATQGNLLSAALPSPLSINPPKETADPPLPSADSSQKTVDDENTDAGPNEPDVKTNDEGLVMVSPSPLDEIDEEDNDTPDDFFDVDALLEPPISPLPPEITYDVPIDVNQDVNNYIILFQTRMRDKFEL